MRLKRLTIVIGFVSAVAMVAAACTSDAPDATRVPTPEFNPTPAGATAAPAPAPTSAPAVEPTEAPAPSGPSGDPVNGEAVFRANACNSCHSVTDATIIGPGLAGLKDRAESRVEGLSAEEYVRQSILSPGSFVVEGFPNAMLTTFGATISEDDLEDLIAYVLTLE